MLTTLKNLGITPDFVVYHFYPQNPGGESDTLLLQSTGNWANDAADLRQQLSDYLGAAGDQCRADRDREQLRLYRSRQADDQPCHRPVHGRQLQPGWRRPSSRAWCGGTSATARTLPEQQRHPCTAGAMYGDYGIVTCGESGHHGRPLSDVLRDEGAEVPGEPAATRSSRARATMSASPPTPSRSPMAR